MNRYAAAGLAEAARQGRRILIVSYDLRASAEALDDFRGLVDDADVTRVNGKQRIAFPSGGRVRFTSVRSRGHRGVVADTVYLDGELDRDPSVIADLLPCIQTSPTGELVRA